MARTCWGDHERFENTYFSYDGYYLTGDGARRDADGHYWITGRVDDVVVVSGHNIGTAEVESALVAHPAVSFCGVLPVFASCFPSCFLRGKNTRDVAFVVSCAILRRWRLKHRRETPSSLIHSSSQNHTSIRGRGGTTSRRGPRLGGRATDPRHAIDATRHRRDATTRRRSPRPRSWASRTTSRARRSTPSSR